MTAPAYDRTIPAAAHGGRFPTNPPAFDVVHSTEGPMSDGNAVALAQWFAKSKANGGPGTSATGIFDPTASVRMLDEHVVPYHVGPEGNDLCTGDEHCGSVNLTPAQWMSTRGQAMLDRSAKVKAQRAIFRGWSLADCRWLTLTEVARRTVRGFCTHNDVRLALGGTTHTDPGPNFPYAWYMSRIRYWFQVLTGAITEGDWFDMADQADLEAAVRKVLRQEWQADQDGDPSVRTRELELINRGVNSAFGPSDVREEVDVLDWGVNSPARRGIDNLITNNPTIQEMQTTLAEVAALLRGTQPPTT